jgi:hypothetical protein
VGHVCTRAHTLCQQTGETPQLARVLWGLSQFQMTQGHGVTAGELAQQLLDLAQRQPDTGYLVEGHFLMGTMAFYRGDFLAARTNMAQSWHLSDTLPSRPATLRGRFVPGVTVRTSLARELWALGYADQAQQRCQDALALARQREHPPSLAYAEACFQRAIAVARRQQAKAVELRAALSLSRLWQQQGKRAAARELLAPIYCWFTEGFDSSDLQEAKALLGELS